ncbi:unnamed protein product [Dracunculus medinensis]|uniref:Uncharacterized protein n=1 Tax=Dracunculus medinensis TaxID=318479 RepID=A0A0N4USA9_DRAME|nr:unnamed protein product [Dracunculus medinensis]
MDGSGGNPSSYQHLFWVMPVFGIASQRRLYLTDK